MLIKKYRFVIYIILLFIVVTSCEKNGFRNNSNNNLIKSEVAGGKTSSEFIYNSQGKIEEKESLYFYCRYSYNSEGKLMSEETSFDPILLSSTWHEEKTELMTSENCSISGRNIYEYNTEDELIMKKHYSFTDNGFEYKSMRRFEYDGGLIVRCNLYNNENEITRFNVFEYDENDNVSKKKYYSYLFNDNSEPKLMSEISYKYDNNKNPFEIFNQLGQPGLYTNQNNVIEANLVSYVETPGINSHSTTITSYEYNKNGYPTKVTTDNSEYSYTY